MTKILCGFGLMLLTVIAAAQAADSGERELREALLQKQLFLRGFSEDATMRWKWNGKGLVRDEPQFFTFGALTVKNIKLKGDHVVIQGDRRTLVRKEGTNFQLSSVFVPVTIDVDLQGAKTNEVLPLLPGVLFFPDLDTALAQLPRAYRGSIPTQTAGRKSTVDIDRNTGTVSLEATVPVILGKSICDCGHPESCEEKVPLTAMQGIEPARPKDVVDAELPEERSDGNPLEVRWAAAAIFVALDDSGRVKYTWLGRPSDPELDQIALRAARESSFRPATCHGKPVSSITEVFIPFSSPTNARRSGRK